MNTPETPQSIAEQKFRIIAELDPTITEEQLLAAIAHNKAIDSLMTSILNGKNED